VQMILARWLGALLSTVVVEVLAEDFSLCYVGEAGSLGE